MGALRAIWGPDPVRYEGSVYRIPGSDIGPKPAHPIPVLMGYANDAGVRRAARIADGLHPFAADVSRLRADIALFRSSAAAAGRDPARLSVVVRAEINRQLEAMAALLAQLAG